MASFLETIGTVVTFLIGQFGNILNLFTTNNVLILLLGIMVCGAIIGLAMRVLHRS